MLRFDVLVCLTASKMALVEKLAWISLIQAAGEHFFMHASASLD